MSSQGRACALGLALALCAVHPVSAQVAPAEPNATSVKFEGFHWGRLLLKPRFDLSGIGWESNVYLVGEEIGPARNDFFTNGGPGLGFTLPFSSTLSLEADSRLQYMWFSQSVDQRKLHGGGGADLRLDTAVVQLSAGYHYDRQFVRPAPEIGRRVDVVSSGPRFSASFARADKEPGRLKLQLAGGYENSSAGGGTTSDYFGNDVSQRLTRSTLQLNPGLSFAATVKTSLILDGRFQRETYPGESALDGNTYGWGVGIETDDTSLVPGRITVGMTRRDPTDPAIPPTDSVSADVRLRLELSAKTRLEPYYNRSLGISLLRTVGASQSTVQSLLGVEIQRAITARVSLRLKGERRTSDASGGGVILDLGQGEQQVLRNEDQYLAQGDLGYSFRLLRVGLVGSWRNRARSAFAVGGVQGFTLGLSAGLLYRP